MDYFGNIECLLLVMMLDSMLVVYFQLELVSRSVMVTSNWN